MKLKKLLAVLLALALAMTCLVSCSKDKDTEDKKESKRISAEQPPKEDPDEGLEEPIENIIEFYETADGECIFDAFPDVLVEQLSDEEEEEILSMVDEYKSYVEMADSMNVDYKIVSKEPIPEEELKSLLIGLSSRYPEYINATFTNDLKTITLRDKTSADVLGLFREEM